MKISSIIITESRSYLYEGLDKKHKNTMFLWESAGAKLIEANLTVDQINQIFANVEQGMTNAGGNRTMLGKGMDAASAVNKAWEDLKTKVQNSGPIKNVDAMYDQAAEKLKQATGGDQGVMKYVQMYRDFAKKHPIAQSLIYSALIAAAGISGAGLGGAAALGLFKMVDKLLQGEKFSSATYSGAKTGAMAYGASKVGDYIKDKFSPYGSRPGENELVGQTGSDSPGASLKVGQELPDGEVVTGLNSSNPNAGVTITRPDGSTYSVSREYAHSLSGQRGISPTGQVYGSSTSDVDAGVRDAAFSRAAPSGDQGGTFVAKGGEAISNSPMTYQQALEKAAKYTSNPIKQKELALTMMKGASARAAGANESVNLTHNQINLIFEHVSDSIILEGITDFVKGAASKAMNWAQTKGRNLTTTITADKLMQAWKKAGSPTDSDQLKQVMVQAGVPENVINNTYSTMKISASVPQAATTAQPSAPQAPTATKAKPAAKTIAKKPAVPNAIAQMTQQLTQPTKSSTGGTITTTQTGIKHTANPNNPNATQPTQTGLVHKANPNNPNFKYANKTLH